MFARLVGSVGGPARGRLARRNRPRRSAPSIERLESRLAPALAAGELGGLFDPAYYAARNPDVAGAIQAGRMTALAHFVQFGQFEGRDPNYLFDTAYYLVRNPDVRAAVARGSMTAYEQFVRFGEYEDRDPSPLFDTHLYLDQNGDVNDAVVNHQTTAFRQFLSSGQWEARSPLALFDPAYYLANNPDVAAGVAHHQISAFEHLVRFGQREGRDPGLYFSNSVYLQSNPDVAQAVSAGQTTALRHYVLSGFAEERPRLRPGLSWSNQSGDGLVRADRAVAAVLGHPIYDRVEFTADIGKNYRDLNEMGVGAVWARGITGQAIVVAVIDTGVNLSHFDLRGQTVQGHNFMPGEDPNDPSATDAFHGTRVAGFVAASGAGGANGVIGAAPGARVMPLKISDTVEFDSGADQRIADAITWATDHGANVINMSFGSNPPPPQIDAAIRYAANHNVVLIAASGNNGDSAPTYPASLASENPPIVLSVGEVDNRRKLAAESNRASGMHFFVVGPGTLVTGPDQGNTFHTGSGTSYAAPYVAGVAALMLQANSHLTAAQVISYLDATADPDVIN
jgi:hypothetical protein